MEEWRRKMKYDLKIITSGDCNFNCSYCYERDDRDVIPKRITSNTIEGIQKLIMNDINIISSISFMGGETFLSIRDIIKILFPIRKILKECDVEISLFTNGSIFNQYIKRFYKIMSKIKSPTVYITDHLLRLNIIDDGALSQHIKFLKDESIDYKLKVIIDRHRLLNFDQTLNYLITNHDENVELVLAYYDKFNKVDECSLNKFISYISDNMNLIPVDILKKILRLFKCDRIIDPDFKLSQIRCGAGVTELAVSGDGRIHGCENVVGASDSEYINVNDVSSITQLSNIYRDFQMFKSKYYNQNETCLKCLFKPLCAQCRYNFTTNKDIYTDKPEEICNFTKLIYLYSLRLGLIISKYIISVYKHRLSNQMDKLVKLQESVDVSKYS